MILRLNIFVIEAPYLFTQDGTSYCLILFDYYFYLLYCYVHIVINHDYDLPSKVLRNSPPKLTRLKSA